VSPIVGTDSTIVSDASASPWYSVFYYLPSFMLGFALGGITGYFGNWLWYRFGPQRTKPHFNMSSQDGRTSFSGLMDETNKDQVARAIRTAPVMAKSEVSNVKAIAGPGGNTSASS